MRSHPRAILFDLDDTLLSAYGRPDPTWIRIVEAHAADFGPIAPAEVAAAITAFGREFWSDPAMHKHWRMRLTEARRRVVAGAMQRLAEAGWKVPEPDRAHRIADRFTAIRDEEMCLFPGTREALDDLRARGVLLGLVTNGAAEPQRGKVRRFGLEHRFHHIQIEGEHGFGKPEERAYTHALERLGVTPDETWMVGDNLEWEVVAPQRLGIYAIWCDAYGVGLPAGTQIRPDRIIRSVSELL
jgi:putative hydrolase of the HAD superfamily